MVASALADLMAMASLTPKSDNNNNSSSSSSLYSFARAKPVNLYNRSCSEVGLVESHRHSFLSRERTSGQYTHRSVVYVLLQRAFHSGEIPLTMLLCSLLPNITVYYQ